MSMLYRSEEKLAIGGRFRANWNEFCPEFQFSPDDWRSCHQLHLQTIRHSANSVVKISEIIGKCRKYSGWFVDNKTDRYFIRSNCFKKKGAVLRCSSIARLYQRRPWWSLPAGASQWAAGFGRTTAATARYSARKQWLLQVRKKMKPFINWSGWMISYNCFFLYSSGNACSQLEMIAELLRLHFSLSMKPQKKAGREKRVQGIFLSLFFFTFL